MTINKSQRQSFAADGYLVVSLLTEPEIFAEGIARIIAARS